jgi:hypothetical protein
MHSKYLDCKAHCHEDGASEQKDVAGLDDKEGYMNLNGHDSTDG